MHQLSTSAGRRAALLIGGLAAGALFLLPAAASSHREAPFVTEHPKVDATDFYFFGSYEPGREDYVVVVANYVPLQDPYGGPNYFSMDPEAAYDLLIDNDGDAVEDLTFRFRFTNTLADLALTVGDPGEERSVPVPLKFIGPVTAGNTSALNETEAYTVEVIEGPSDGKKKGERLLNADTAEDSFIKPLDNVGAKTIADYEAYAAAHLYDVEFPDGSLGRMFVGQRADPFVVNLGETFDLINTNPLGPVDGEANTLADANVTSLVLEIPKSFLLADVAEPSPILGGWTAASLPRKRSLSKSPTFEEPARESLKGPRQQVSRLGAPLVNEVVIGLGDKNLFNASRPVDDAQFLDYVTHPTLPEIIQLLFGVQAPDSFPRQDLVQIFLTGVPGVNENGSVGEMLRLNTSIPAVDAEDQEPLGVLAGDLAGYPNGRRPGDDVVDISLRAVMGVLLSPEVAPDGALPYTDGAAIDATDFPAAFPFLNTPFPGSPD